MPRLTDGVLDAETVQLCLRQAAPYSRLVDFGSILDTAVQGYDVLDEDVNGHFVLLVLLVDEESFLVQTVLCGDPGDIS